ncbi:cytochrome P450 3A21-like [Oppia nitens]|uniref:cytochrome P450 3A21-like n=1 Tax=Oppia nitens TaxID=1686743 RepID=UPI0023DB9614|nr:cytochrome P450 3A21-like [Oppia nitens]
MELFVESSWLFYGLLSSIPLLYWYFTRNFNYWKSLGINGPKPIVGFGTLLYQFLTPKPYLELEWYKKYGKLYGILNGSNPALTIAEPELIKHVLVKDFNSFADRTRKRRIHPILKHHLIESSGDDWKRLRSIITPTFTSGKMKKMYPMIADCLNDFVNALDVYARDKQEVNIKDMYGNFTMDVIATCAFATKTNTHKDPNNPFMVNTLKIFNPKLYRILPAIVLPNFVQKALGFFGFDESANDFFFNITRHIIKQRQQSGTGSKHNDFIQLLLNIQNNNNNSHNNHNKLKEDNDNNEAHYVNEGEEELAVEKRLLTETDKYITEEEILANAWIFFQAGYETTASTLTFCTYELALNPDIQERLYDEVMTSVNNSSGNIDYDLLAKLPFLDAVISETLRIHSPVLRLGRACLKDYKLADTGITIKKGQAVEIPVYAIHHSEEYYERPSEFIPDRFLPENRHKIIPYTYLPFGVGPRNCIGMRFALMEAKLGLAQIVKRFRFTRNRQTDVPFNLKKSPILLSPKRVVVTIERRN